VVATVFFASVVFLGLGEGGMERVAAYVIPVGLAVAGVALWRQGDSWWELTNPDGTPTRRQLREDARLERAQRQAERDAALEAAARRSTEQRTAGTPGGTPGRPDDDEPDDFDPEDPWAAPRR
jgi:hypothetical protein